LTPMASEKSTKITGDSAQYAHGVSISEFLIQCDSRPIQKKEHVRTDLFFCFGKPRLS
jgi:hypothetical protein